MEWEFTAEDVVKARSAYALEDFRRDLAEEVRINLGSSDPLQHARTFNLLYDMCHALATGRALEDFLQPYAYDPPTCEFLREVPVDRVLERHRHPRQLRQRRPAPGIEFRVVGAVPKSHGNHAAGTRASHRPVVFKRQRGHAPRHAHLIGSRTQVGRAVDQRAVQIEQHSPHASKSAHTATLRVAMR